MLTVALVISVIGCSISIVVLSPSMQKGLILCLSDFTAVNGLQLLVSSSTRVLVQQLDLCPLHPQSITNDDIKALPTLVGNEKKRK